MQLKAFNFGLGSIGVVSFDCSSNSSSSPEEPFLPRSNVFQHAGVVFFLVYIRPDAFFFTMLSVSQSRVCSESYIVIDSAFASTTAQGGAGGTDFVLDLKLNNDFIRYSHARKLESTTGGNYSEIVVNYRTTLCSLSTLLGFQQ